MKRRPQQRRQFNYAYFNFGLLSHDCGKPPPLRHAGREHARLVADGDAHQSDPAFRRHLEGRIPEGSTRRRHHGAPLAASPDCRCDAGGRSLALSTQDGVSAEINVGVFRTRRARW